MSIPVTSLKFPLQGLPIDRTGNWTPTWHQALQALFTRVGADSAPSNSDLAAAIAHNVTGPGVSVDGDVAVFSGATGFAIRDGGVQLSALATNSALTTGLASKAPLSSPPLTGVPTAPTPPVGTNTTQLATTAYVQTAIAPLTAQNVVINGGFRINQRNVSGTVTLAAGIYGHDRWKAGASGCTYTFATSGNVTTITITAGSLQQVIEGVNLRTGTYVMSWTGTAQGKIAGGSFSATGVTASITGGTNTTIEFNSGTLTGVQVSAGSVPQPYLDIGDAAELLRCFRYCYRMSTDTNGATTNAIQSSAGWLSATAGLVQGRYPIRMRTQPSLVVEGGAAQFSIFTLSSSAFNACTAVTLGTNTNADSYFLNFSTSAGGTVGHIAFFGTNAQVTNSLRFEAEL